MDPSTGGWVGHRRCNSSNSTYCELRGILEAVRVLLQRRLNGVVILLALSSPQPTCYDVVQEILQQLASAFDNSLIVTFLWTPSHVGIASNDTVDLIAKNACRLPPPDNARPSLRCYKKTIHKAAHLATLQRRDSERTQSVSIQHYDHFRQSPPKYRRHGLKIRRHNVMTARLRLGYRPVWQVCEAGDAPHYSACKLCGLPNDNHLQHYCLECPSVMDLLPQGQSMTDTCI